MNQQPGLPQLPPNPEPRFSRKTIISLVIIIFLLIALPVLLYLSQHTQIWRPKANTSSKPSPCGNLGDVNLDGQISAADTNLIGIYLTEMQTLTAEQQSRADTDGNSQVQEADVALIDRYISGHITTFPACPPPRGASGDFWADIVLGKRGFGEVSPLEVVDDKVHAPGGIIVDRFTVPSGHPGRAYIWDSGNNRILGLDLQECYSKPAGQRCKANIVIGQPSANDYGACNQDSSFQKYPNRSKASASTLCGIYDGSHTILEDKSAANMYVDNQGNLYVPDANNNRVLKYLSPFTTDTVADEVWGQDNFLGNECNKTGNRVLRNFPNATSSSLCFMADDTGSYGSGVALDNQGNLWVADGGNSRVLRFPKDASGNISKTADLVLGQPNFTSRTTGGGLNQMYAPIALRFDSQGKLYVADAGSDEPNNKRILVFNPPFTSGMNASGTFGTGFARKDPGGFAWDRNPMEIELDPQGRGIWTFENVGWEGVIKLWSFDGTTVTTQFTVGARGIGSIGFDNLGNILYSSYTQANVYHYTPQSNGNYVFNRYLFSPPDGYNLLTPRRFIPTAWTGVAVAGNQLIVSDSRLLFWNLGSNYDLSVLSNGKTPDGYVGASSFTNVPNPQYSQLKSDASNRVWAAKTDSIVVYQAPLTTGTSPIKTITSPLNVLGGGQVTFDSTKGVWGLAPTTDGQFLWVSQPYKHRVFRVRNPLSDNPMVDVILGQIEVNGIYCNRNPNDPANTNAWAVPNPSFVSANTLCYPGAISLDKQNNLYVSDHYIEIAGNKRLLMFSANNFLANNSSVTFAPNASKEFSGSATFEPAFDSTNRMVIGFNPYTNNRFLQYFNPSNTTFVPDGRLEDFYNWPVALTFDYYDNLYAYDANRGQVRIYKNPFNNPSPPPMPISKLSPCPPIGDVDNDGYVTNIDALAVLKIVAKLDPYKNPTEDQLRRANVDTRNNNVTSVDSLIIKRYLGGLETTFRACAQPPPTPNPTTTPSPSPSPNASRLTVNTTCSGLDTSYPSNHVDLTITGTVIPPTNNTTNGVWMTVTDQSSNNTAFTTYYGSLGQFSVNSSYHDSIINIRGTSLKLMGDGRNYLIGAYMGPYTYNIPTLTNPFYQTNFSVTCPFASPSPSTGRYPIN